MGAADTVSNDSMVGAAAGASIRDGGVDAPRGICADTLPEKNIRTPASAIENTDFVIWTNPPSIPWSAENLIRLIDDGKQDRQKANAHEHHARIAFAQAKSYKKENNAEHRYSQQTHISEEHSQSQEFKNSL